MEKMVNRNCELFAVEHLAYLPVGTHLFADGTGYGRSVSETHLEDTS
jgi:hypothetical protein